eukprot:744909-Ditylum_brightwellii.AAC.2
MRQVNVCKGKAKVGVRLNDTHKILWTPGFHRLPNRQLFYVPTLHTAKILARLQKAYLLMPLLFSTLEKSADYPGFKPGGAAHARAPDSIASYM